MINAYSKSLIIAPCLHGVSDFTCRCAPIFGGETPQGAVETSPAIGCAPTSLVPIASDSEHPGLRLQLPDGVPSTN